jgi:hypothetical protein
VGEVDFWERPRRVEVEQGVVDGIVLNIDRNCRIARTSKKLQRCLIHSSSPGTHCPPKPPCNRPKPQAIHNRTINLTCARRTLDPIFAVSVGITAAAVRINREEKEKGKSFEESKASLQRRAALAWREVMGEEEKVVKSSG